MHPFDYAAYWQDVTIKAGLDEVTADIPAPTCPKVFIYNLTQPFRDSFEWWHASEREVFGSKVHCRGKHRCLGEVVRQTGQYTFAMALLSDYGIQTDAGPTSLPVQTSSSYQYSRCLGHYESGQCCAKELPGTVF
jgi:hypothetical protein